MRNYNEVTPVSITRILAELAAADEPVIINRSIVYGRGTFACVYQGILKSTNEFVAVKEVKFNNKSDFERQKCEKEAAILKKLNARSPKSVIPFIGAYENINKDSFYFILPQMVNGQLTEWLHDENVMNSTRQLDTTLCITEGMKYIHGKNVIHRDFKAENVLFDANFKPVIIDFGLSTRIGIDKVTKDIAGSPAYLSPELLTAAIKQISIAEVLTKKVDIYSLALVIWQIFAREADLFCQFNNIFELEEFVAEENGRPTLPAEKDCPKEIAKLITWGWAQNPHDRPTAARVEAEVRKYASTLLAK